MPRPLGVQITRDGRKDGSTTYGLRVRHQGADQRVPLGNSQDGWDEIRAEQARRQLVAKIELGQWTPMLNSRSRGETSEPTFRELATDWLEARRRNPGIRPRTIEANEWQLTRYLSPFFGELKPSEITPATVKNYRERIHSENDQIRSAADAGRPLRDAWTGQKLRTLGTRAINETLRSLAMILDDAEDAGWVDRNVARGRRMREPLERRRTRGALDLDELQTMLEAAEQLDQHHTPRTLEQADLVRRLRDNAGMEWKRIAAHLGVAPTTAIYLYGCAPVDGPSCGPRRAILATLAFAGLRVGELCRLDSQDLNLDRMLLRVRDAKTEAGIRTVDLQPVLFDQITAYRRAHPSTPMDAPLFPTRTGSRRDRNGVLQHVLAPAVRRANELRAEHDEPPIHTHVTPHTLRRTYITFLIAAGLDLPYVQAQVGHVDPTTTLRVYAQVMARRDRDQLRSEIRQLLGLDPAPAPAHQADVRQLQPSLTRLRAAEKARKGPTVSQ